MTAKSPAATGTAERLWTRTAGGTRNPAEVAVAADLVCTELRVGLGRWIGAGGYRALLERARSGVRAKHPALDEFSCLGGDDPGLVAAVRAQGADGLSAAIVALVAELVELLGRIIGDDMAVQLVDQILTTSPRGVVSTQPRGARDGD